jgi:signal transduction histidine kinase
LNLLSNAVKFSKEGQAIYLISADSPTGKTFQVKDNGIGIPTADLPHIFSTFFRASNVTEIQGTGLGLSLVKRYTDLIGGTVKLETEFGKGTSITLDVPNMNVSS